MTMQITPPIDDEILSCEELAKITEREQKDAQIAWLKTNNWYYTLSSKGKPIVGRWYARMRLAGIILPDQIGEPQTGMPNFNNVR